MLLLAFGAMGDLGGKAIISPLMPATEVDFGSTAGEFGSTAGGFGSKRSEELVASDSGAAVIGMVSRMGEVSGMDDWPGS